MRMCKVLLGLSAVMLICAAAPLEDEMASNSNAEELLDVDAQTVHENESGRKVRQFYYNPYGGLYGGYGGYGGYYGGYGGYGYGYRRYPYYGYGNYPYYGGYSYYG